MKFPVLVLFLLSSAEQGISFQCYTNDKLSDDATCDADADLCYEVATIKDNSDECVYLRGCIKEPIDFPDQASINHLVKVASQNQLFRVCATDKCNRNRKPDFDCKPKNFKKMYEDTRENNTILEDGITIIENKLRAKDEEINILREKVKDTGTTAAGTNGPLIGCIITIVILGLALLGVSVYLWFVKKEVNKTQEFTLTQNS